MKPYKNLFLKTITSGVPDQGMVHDTENLTFSEEFRGCFAQTPADSCVERRGSSARVPHGQTQIFRVGGRESSAQTDMDLPCRLGLKMAKTRGRTLCATMLKDRETRRKDRSNYHCKNRTYLDMKY